MRRFFPFILLLLPLFQLIAADAGAVTEVRKALMCTCPDCTMVLHTCECGTADQMTASIRGMLDDGLSADAVIQAYVARYGESVLSAPTKKGFNLLAWVVPFAVLGMGSVFVVRLVKRWTANDPGASPGTDDGRETRRPLDETVLARVERELQELGI